MTSHPHRKPHKPGRTLPRFFYRWHRRIGASAALFITWLVISGWALNHSDSLNLAQQQIHSPVLANWYNLTYQTPTQVFASQNHWLVSNLLDGKTLTTYLNDPVGLTETENLIAIANSHELILLNPNGELIDKLSDSSVPIKNITKIGKGCAGIVITNNTQIFSTQDGIDWQSCEENITWAIAQNIKPEQLKQIKPLLVPEISLEKVIVDLHTGRFFGRYGAYVVDAVGGCLMLLALSGLWLFFRVGNKSNR